MAGCQPGQHEAALFLCADALPPLALAAALRRAGAAARLYAAPFGHAREKGGRGDEAVGGLGLRMRFLRSSTMQE